MSYLPYICAFLAYGGEELYACHPFCGTETGFAREIVHMRDQAFQDIFQSRIGGLRVDEMHVIGNVVNCEVFEDRHVDLVVCVCHCGVFDFSADVICRERRFQQ